MRDDGSRQLILLRVKRLDAPLCENRRHDIGRNNVDLPDRILTSPGLLAANSGQFGPTETARAPPNAMKMPPMTAMMKHFMGGSVALAAPISTACNERMI